MNNYIIRRGRVVDPVQNLDAERTVVLSDGIIQGTYEDDKLPALKGEYQEIDASGMIVMPGLVDLHVHFREPGEEWKEDIESGSKAAVKGGFTAVVTMPNTIPPNDSPEVTAYIIKRSLEVGLIRIYPAGRILKAEGDRLSPIGEMVRAGAVAFTNDGEWCENTRLMERALEYSKAFNTLIMSHAEDHSLTDEGQINEGRLSLLLGLKGMPREAEEIAVFRDVKLAELTGGRLHIQHISTAGSVEIIRKAKSRGLKNITCEVTPHHLVFTEKLVEGFNTNAKVKPPLRTDEDRLALIKGLNDGTIDCIATDHAPHSELEKNVEFNLAAFGISSLETALPLMMNLVREGHISLLQLVRLLSTNPARIAGIEGGSLKPGARADVIVFDPHKKWQVTEKSLVSKGKNTPLLGRELKGKVIYTLIDGKIVYYDGEKEKSHAPS